MPYARVRSLSIHYHVVGDHGPWVALSPGGRSTFSEFSRLASGIASAGYRVLLHDRRNCGASQVGIDDSQSEDWHRVDDLHELMLQLDALPAFIGGSSSGCRMSLLYCLRYPSCVRGLLLMRITSGRFAATQLPENYYGQYIRAAQRGGMAAVCSTDHWHSCIERFTPNRDILMFMPARRFIAAMSRWLEMFLQTIDEPVIGLTKKELEAIQVPTLIIPGNDRTHSRTGGLLAHSLIQNSLLHQLKIPDSAAELVPFVEWAELENEISAAFISFMDDCIMNRKSAAKVG